MAEVHRRPLEEVRQVMVSSGIPEEEFYDAYEVVSKWLDLVDRDRHFVTAAMVPMKYNNVSGIILLESTPESNRKCNENRMVF